ncbi:MAG: arsenate reductase ArsC [Acidobacteriota bacterium]
MLFVCIGNTCRSPMAEGFANKYGGDVLVARSSGLSPVLSVIPETVAIMEELNIDISKHVPMPYDPLLAGQYDFVINMSGFRLPGKPPKELLEWKVTDPYMNSAEVYRKVRADIEDRVMQLILRLRRERKA